MRFLRKPRIRPERGILLLVFLLCCFGLVMVYSSSAVLGIARANSSAHFFEGQLVKSIVGAITLLCFWNLDYHHLQGRLQRGVLILIFAALTALAIEHLVTGKICRWLTFGDRSIQPSEFARIALVVFLASYISRKERWLRKSRRYLVPAGGIVLTAFLIALQPNLSMTLIVLLLGAGILFLAGIPLRWLALGTGIPTLIAVGLGTAYQGERIKGFIDLLLGRGAGYQLDQSMTAVGSGGLIGLGLGNGLQKYFYLPFPHTDFILGIVGEETGLLGLTLLFAAYALLIVLGITAARHAPDRFGLLLAAGLTWNLSLNVLLHGAVNLGMGPVTGVPLPFLSCGGSSLVANLLAMGILLSVARRSVFARVRDWSSIGGFAQ